MKPLVKDVNEPGGRLDPRFKGIAVDVPTKEVVNTKHDMKVLELYLHGELKFEDIGKVCGNCVNFYPDPNLGKRPGGPVRGRCKARGFIRIHEELPADEKENWTDPDTGTWFRYWPECPLYTDKVRLSRR